MDTVEHCSWRTPGGGFDADPQVAEAMAAQDITACPTPTRNWRRMASLIGQQRAEHYHHRLRWLDEHGVRLVAGTDAGTRGRTRKRCGRSAWSSPVAAPAQVRPPRQRSDHPERIPLPAWPMVWPAVASVCRSP